MSDSISLLVTSGQNLTISGVAAGLSHTLHHPLYTLKSQMMYRGQNFRFGEFLSRSFKEPRKFLYRGLIQRTFGIMPEKAMKMQAWEVSCKFIERKNENLMYTKWLISGALAGAATTVVGCPSERAMVLAQIRKQGFVQVIRTTGLKGLYQGWTATLYRDIIFNTVFFTMRKTIVHHYMNGKGLEEEPDSFLVRVLLGFPAGCMASIAGCPHDVIKTRMQGVRLDAEYRSCWQIFNDIVNKEGPRYLMKGLLPRLIAVPSMMSFFYVINQELEKLKERFTN